MKDQAVVTILGEVTSRNITTSKGIPKTVYGQKAQLETEQLRYQFELECDGPAMGLPVGAKRLWDVIKDVVPGTFGPELARRMSLMELPAGLPAKA